MKAVKLELIKCDCDRLLIVVDGDEIEVSCGKCREKVRIPIARLTGTEK